MLFFIPFFFCKRLAPTFLFISCVVPVVKSDFRIFEIFLIYFATQYSFISVLQTTTSHLQLMLINSNMIIYEIPLPYSLEIPFSVVIFLLIALLLNVMVQKYSKDSDSHFCSIEESLNSSRKFEYNLKKKCHLLLILKTFSLNILIPKTESVLASSFI